MPKSPAGQLSLDSLFDTTAISSGFTLGGESIARPVFDDEEDEAPAGPPAVAFRPPPRNWVWTVTGCSHRTGRGGQPTT